GTGGLGSALASILLDEGVRLVMSYRSNADRAAVWKDRAATLQADLTANADRSRLLDAAPALYGLVVLAGDPVRTGDILNRSHEANYLGPVLLAREAAERMKATATPGAIVL